MHCSDQMPVFYLPEFSHGLKILSCLMAKNISDTQNYTCPQTNFALVYFRVEGQKKRARAEAKSLSRTS